MFDLSEDVLTLHCENVTKCVAASSDLNMVKRLSTELEAPEVEELRIAPLRLRGAGSPGGKGACHHRIDTQALAWSRLHLTRLIIS